MEQNEAFNPDDLRLAESDLKTLCQQIAVDFIWCGKETDSAGGGPWQRIVGLSRGAGAGQR